jgi:hypothetical protein
MQEIRLEKKVRAILLTAFILCPMLSIGWPSGLGRCVSPNRSFKSAIRQGRECDAPLAREGYRVQGGHRAEISEVSYY